MTRIQTLENLNRMKEVDSQHPHHCSDHVIIEQEAPHLKVLGVVVYFFIEKYVCVDYLCLKRGAKF